MSIRRTSQPAAPAVVVALSMAICLGAAIDVTASSQSQRTGTHRPAATLTSAEREALASLLACLSDTARQLKPAPQAAQPNLAPHHLPAAGFAPAPAPTESTLRNHDPLHPATLVRARLLNLPPPALL